MVAHLYSYPKSEFLNLERACKIHTHTRAYYESAKVTEANVLHVAKQNNNSFKLYAFRFFPDLPVELRNKI